MKGYQTKREPQRCGECQRPIEATHRRNKSIVCADCKTGYRVDFMMRETGTYAEYTALKIPVTLAMAQALSRGLKRQGQAGRIVQVPEGDILEVW